MLLYAPSDRELPSATSVRKSVREGGGKGEKERERERERERADRGGLMIDG